MKRQRWVVLASNIVLLGCGVVEVSVSADLISDEQVSETFADTQAVTDEEFQCEEGVTLEFYRMASLRFLRSGEGCDLDSDGIVDNEAAQWLFLGLPEEATLGSSIPLDQEQVLVGLDTEHRCSATKLWVTQYATRHCGGESGVCQTQVVVTSGEGKLCEASLSVERLEGSLDEEQTCAFSGKDGEVLELSSLFVGSGQHIRVRRFEVRAGLQQDERKLVLCGDVEGFAGAGTTSTFAVTAELESVPTPSCTARPCQP